MDGAVSDEQPEPGAVRLGGYPREFLSRLAGEAYRKQLSNPFAIAWKEDILNAKIKKMKGREIKSLVLIIGLVAVVMMIAGSYYYGGRNVERPVACTQEAKLCPDGSAVGRTGPNCEFAECPAAAPTSTAGGGAGILPYNSGVRGTVLLGPTCPVQKIPPDPKCDDRPYATSIAVYRGTSVFATGESDKDGVFQFSLPPGIYTLKASGGAMLPRCSPADVTVGPSGYITADISCDTGIR